MLRGRSGAEGHDDDDDGGGEGVIVRDLKSNGGDGIE